MPRFYYPHPLIVGMAVTLPDTLTHHIRVLRLIPGDTITLFNGTGGEYTATLTDVEKKQANAEIKLFSPREAELPYALTLAQALPESAKIDWIVEKAVELGITVFQPLLSQRCVVRLSTERAAKKYLHWEKITAAAAEQSGRNRLPHLAPLHTSDEWVVQQDLHLRIMLTPSATDSLATWARHHSPQAMTLLIGPEGGFNQHEEDCAKKHNIIPLSLGPRTLRTETAGLAAIALLKGIWGEM